MRLFATCDAGLEDALAAELAALGAARPRAASRGASFEGGPEVLWRANLESRIATRVLVPLATFSAPDRAALLRGATAIDWARHVAPGRTIAVDARCGASALAHSGFVAQVVKDAICDRLRGDRGSRPDVDRRRPDVPVAVRLVEDRCTVSLDSSGERLHRRGYRREGGEAPLKETLAAGVLALAGHDGGRPLLDPMCGSGTFLVEAALAARRIPPGLLRLAQGRVGFAFQRSPGHDPGAFRALVAELEAGILPRPGAPIVGSDREAGAVELARRNLARAGLEADVEVRVADLGETEPAGPGGLVVTNPPYGERLGAGADLPALYRALGDRLKQRFGGGDAWILTGDLGLAKSLGLRSSKRLTLWNGPIECRLIHLELYDGSRRLTPARRAAARRR